MLTSHPLILLVTFSLCDLSESVTWWGASQSVLKSPAQIRPHSRHPRLLL